MRGFLSYFGTLDESLASFLLKFGHMSFMTKKPDCNDVTPSLKQCYDLLYKTGRSFGFLLNLLDKDLRDTICILYLVLRAADTIEDDMSIPKDIKIRMLKSFKECLLDPNWKYTESKDEYAEVLEKFPVIVSEFQKLPIKYQEIILDISTQFSGGMAKYVGIEMITMEDVDKYSYYAGALFCFGVFRLFVSSGQEDEFSIQDQATISQFNLFLHKTNFIRDFWRDWHSGRCFWPKEMWSKYVSSPADLMKHENLENAVKCLNEFLTDALQHLVPCLHYMNKMRSVGPRSFFTINMMMALASLERFYNNPNVFQQTVKIRRGETAKLILSSSSNVNVLDNIRYYTFKILQRTSCNNEEDKKIREICLKILDKTDAVKLNAENYSNQHSMMLFYLNSATVVILVSLFLWYLSI